MAREKYKTLFVISGLAIAVLAVFWRVHEFEFLNYDDNEYVSKNEHIVSGLAAENIVWAFTSRYCSNWHPVTWLSHMLDYKLFDLNSGRHHLVNLIFHIANTLLIFFVFRQMTGAFWQSTFVAAAFGLHPLHVESVAWVSERKDVLSTLFWILTIAAYLRYSKSLKAGRYVLVPVLFALGLMSKPMLVTLPFMLLLLDYWPLERFGKRTLYQLILEKLPLFILSAVSCTITMVAQSEGGALRSTKEFDLSVRVSNAVVSYVSYIIKMIWPLELAVYYPHPGDKLVWWQILVSVILLIGITAWVVRISSGYKYLLTGWFWYLGTLAPVIGLVQAGSQSMADRYTYIPFIGLFIAVAWGVNELLAKWEYGEAVLWVSSLVVILIFAILTWVQVGYWRDSMSLFNHALKVTRENDVAYNNRGTVYYDRGELDRAIADYNDALAINPVYAQAYYNRGKAYNGKRKYDLAISDYSRTIEISPRLADAYVNRGNAYKSKSLYELAISDYNMAIKINPRLAEAYNNRGTVYGSKGRLDHAISDYNKAIEINPRFAWAYFNKACACESAGRKAEAVEAYKAFIQYAPADVPQIEYAKQRIKELER